MSFAMSTVFGFFTGPWWQYVTWFQAAVLAQIPGLGAVMPVSPEARATVSAWAAGLTLLSLWSSAGMEALVLLVGFAYPTFMSFKALRNNSPGSATAYEDDAQWLMYWVTFGFFSVFETFAGLLLRVIPFYSVIKIAVLALMMHPDVMLAGKIYTGVVGPLLLKAEPLVDEFLQEAAAAAAPGDGTASAAAPGDGTVGAAKND